MSDLRWPPLERLALAQLRALCVPGAASRYHVDVEDLLLHAVVSGTIVAFFRADGQATSARRGWSTPGCAYMGTWETWGE